MINELAYPKVINTLSRVISSDQMEKTGDRKDLEFTRNNASLIGRIYASRHGDTVGFTDLADRNRTRNPYYTSDKQI